MLLRIAEKSEVVKLTEASKKAFHTDFLVGGDPDDGPPDYDSVTWHEQMRKEGHLYAYFTNDGALVGGAVLFDMTSKMYIGRIFIHPAFHRRGYGLALMNDIEKMNPKTKELELDTPLVNRRTNALYRKLGYCEISHTEDTISYKKILP